MGKTKGRRRLDMAFRHRHKRAAKGFGKIGAVDETKGDNTGHHRINIYLVDTQRIGHHVKRDLQSVKYQQH